MPCGATGGALPRRKRAARRSSTPSSHAPGAEVGRAESGDFPVHPSHRVVHRQHGGCLRPGRVPSVASASRVRLFGLEVGQGCEHAAVIGRLGAKAELGEDGGHMGFDGLGVDEQVLGDGLVRSAFGEES